MGAGGGSSRAGSGLLSEWVPSRWTFGGGAFCRRPPPPPPPPGPGSARKTSRVGSWDTTSSGGASARSDQPRLATTAIASAASPWRPVDTSTGTPLGRGTSGATATIARVPAPTVEPLARARTLSMAWSRATSDSSDSGPGPAVGRLPRAARSSTTAGETRAAAAISASVNTSSSGTANMAAGIPSQNACRIGGHAGPGPRIAGCRRIAGDFPIRRGACPAGSRSAVRGRGQRLSSPSVPTGPPGRTIAPLYSCRMSNDAAFAGKVAVVTGASSGIGQATALALARAGARVVLVSRDAAAWARWPRPPAARRTSSRRT